MKVLGISAVTGVLSVALIDGEMLLSERTVTGEMSHSENLTYFIEQILKEAKLSPKELEAVAVTEGPGSYSGIRGSLAMAKTLAQALLIPVIGVSTLEAMTYGVEGEEILVVLDACRNEFNLARFQKVKEGYRRLQDDEVVDTKALKAGLQKLNSQTVVVFSEKVQKEFPEIKAIISYPKGESVARIGWDKIQQGEIPSLFAVQPKYSHNPNIRTQNFQFPIPRFSRDKFSNVQLRNNYLNISKLTPADIDEVYALEQKCFTVPKELAVFLTDQNKYYVAKENNKIIGYIGFEEIAGEGHIINMAVAPEYRQQGIGKELMQYVLDQGSKDQIKVFYLEVRASNFSAQKLYEKFGFKVVGRRKGYYQDNQEDALLMKLSR